LQSGQLNLSFTVRPDYQPSRPVARQEWGNLIGADLSFANLTGVIRIDPILTPKFTELEAQLATATTERDAVVAERDAAITERDARPTQASYDAVVAERDARPTLAQVQDARIGPIVVERDWQSGQVSLSLGLEKTEDAVSWTAYEGGTWTETAGGEFTLSFPLTETKNWVRLALKE
jgi:hypothetical protein